MNTVELTIQEYQRIKDAILWILSPYTDDENGISEHLHAQNRLILTLGQKNQPRAGKAL